MLVGTTLYVRLKVYMGLSLFIIRRALRVSGCMRTYTYNLTRVHMKCFLSTMFELREYLFSYDICDFGIIWLFCNIM